MLWVCPLQMQAALQRHVERNAAANQNFKELEADTACTPSALKDAAAQQQKTASAVSATSHLVKVHLWLVS